LIFSGQLIWRPRWSSILTIRISSTFKDHSKFVENCFFCMAFYHLWILNRPSSSFPLMKNNMAAIRESESTFWMLRQISNFYISNVLDFHRLYQSRRQSFNFVLRMFLKLFSETKFGLTWMFWPIKVFTKISSNFVYFLEPTVKKTGFLLTISNFSAKQTFPVWKFENMKKLGWEIDWHLRHLIESLE
jgi:hypothetical protein